MATITVRRNDLSAPQPRFTGRVLVDRQLLGYLVGVETRIFNVESGEHTVTVDFGRRLRVFSSPGRATSSASLSLAACERADFACGINPEVVRAWVQARRDEGLRLAGFTTAVILASWTGWLLSPFLRRAVAVLVLHLPDRGPLIPTCYRLVSPVFCAFWFAVLAGWVARRFSFYPRAETDQQLLSRIGSPYYLERLVADDSKARSCETREF